MSWITLICIWKGQIKCFIVGLGLRLISHSVIVDKWDPLEFLSKMFAGFFTPPLRKGLTKKQQWKTPQSNKRGAPICWKKSKTKLIFTTQNKFCMIWVLLLKRYLKFESPLRPGSKPRRVYTRKNWRKKVWLRIIFRQFSVGFPLLK